MGFQPSLYIATRHLQCAKIFLLGNRLNPGNPFHWLRVKLNLPGMDDLDQRQSCVYKVREDGRIAGDLVIYIDDLRVACPDLCVIWDGVQQVDSCINFLGLQHAPRKLHELMKKAGAWAGSVVHTESRIFFLTSQEKWDKTKTIL